MENQGKKPVKKGKANASPGDKDNKKQKKAIPVHDKQKKTDSPQGHTSLKGKNALNMVQQAQIKQLATAHERISQGLQNMPSTKYDPSRPRVCYIHFGMPKTGSTSIQNSLFRIGARDDWCYVNAGTANSSMASVVAFKTMAANGKGSNKKGLDALPISVETIDSVRNAFEACLKLPANRYIFSSEALGRFSEKEIATIVEWFRQYVDEVVAVGYIRPAKGFMESALQQRLKGRELDDLFHLHHALPRYRTRIEKFDNVLGKENVKLRVFEREKLVDGDVVMDFAKLVGLNISPSESFQSNESLSLDGIRLLLLFRNCMIEQGKIQKLMLVRQWIMRDLQTVGGPKLRLSNSLVDQALRLEMADIQWGQERLGGQVLYEPSLADEAGQVRSLNQGVFEEITEPMVSWFNRKLRAVEAEPLAAHPSRDQALGAVKTLVDRLPQLVKHLKADQEVTLRAVAKPDWMPSLAETEEERDTATV